MSETQVGRRVGLGLMYSAGLAAGAYAAYAGSTYLRYGHLRRPVSDEGDTLLDRFMPAYDVVERHQERIAAPVEITFAALCGVDPQQSALVRAIFRGRQLILGSKADSSPRPRGLVAWTQTLGWNVLAEIPGREVVLGAVTQPWKANVVFRGLAPDTFADFKEPDYVKIVWNLRADPVGLNVSIARTETRVATTDPAARRKFRRYWSIFSPGIILIRRATLYLAKQEAERRTRERQSQPADRFDLVSAGDLDPEC
jgi:hypothetical protein